MELPHELDGASVLKYAVIAPDVEPTGATRHVRGGVVLGPAAALAVAQYSDDAGYYLVYLGRDGSVVTDTYHDSLEGALAQAAHEYRGLRWVDSTGARETKWRAVPACATAP